jgi:hypothetical protein
MPKLLLFAPCEKVLVDEMSHTTSLIAVLQEIHYKVPPGTQIQSGALLPMNWSIVSIWQEEDPADAEVEFEQRVLLENTAGKAFMENVVRWKFERPSRRIVGSVPGIPIGSRKLTLKLSYRVALARDWHEVASFPLELMQDVL